MARVDYFLKLDGIQGESQDVKHKGEIELSSWSWGATNSGTFGNVMGGGAGRVNVQDFTFSQIVQNSSPHLVKACCTGKHIKQAMLTCRKASGDLQGGIEYLKIKFTDVLVAHYQTGGSPGDVIPQDSISLNFAKIHYSYAAQNADGTAGGATEAWYDTQTSQGG